MATSHPSLWRSPRGWPLRTRIVAMMIVLLALIGLAVGTTAEIYLSKQLYSQMDAKVSDAWYRALGFGGRDSDGQNRKWPGGPSSGAPGGGGSAITSNPNRNTPPIGSARYSIFLFLLAPGSSTPIGGGLVQFSDGSTQDGSPVTQSGYASISDKAKAALLSVPVSQIRTVSVTGIGKYRVVASMPPGGGEIIAALPLDDTETTLLNVALFTGGSVLIAVVIAGWVGAFVIRRTLAPLSRVASTATRVSELELDRGEVDLAQRVPAEDTDPRTEVGQVGSALNRLLDHVGNALEARHASEMHVRQFVADASHELRTPLAAIRGYAELSRRSRQEVPPEIAHVLGRVESEAKRMTVLVEDLLLLARLDAGRPLAHDPVDLTMLVVDTVSDAHAAGPRYNWQLDLPEDPVTVIGDGARLHQVLANLLANARTHTPEGTTVTVGVAATTDSAVLTVTDSGPGIPAELQPHIFERFARGDSSRSRAAGSTGLGLSIVYAVVTAHGGQVAVHSRPGETVFTVRLPTSPPAGVPAIEQFARTAPLPR